MGTIIMIIVAAAVIGGIFGIFSGEKDGAATGAIGGAYVAGSCLFQLLITGLVIMAAIWVFSLVFG